MKLVAKFFSKPDFCINIQQFWDLYHSQLTENNDLKTIQPLTLSAN